MNLPTFKEITNKAHSAFNRFPITISWAITGSLLVIGILNGNPELLFQEYLDSLLTYVLGISWLIGTRFFIEHLKNPEKWGWLKLITLLLLIAFYWQLPDLNSQDVDPKFFIRFLQYLIAGHLFVFVAPFILKWNSKAYWNYLKSICLAIARSLLFSGVLYLGLVLALAAIQALFDVEIQSKRFGQLFVICLGIVNTWIYLSDFPKGIFQKTTINYNKALEVLVKFILIPLVLLYLVILYAYSIKIIWVWELPKGWVSYLVTALAFLGFLIQVLINPVQNSLKAWGINKFYPWFYIMLLPLIALLFVAIFRRIIDYGITENRYFVLIIAFWILGMVLYLLFSKKKRLKMLPVTLCLFTLITSFGFWGAFSISKNSQIKQFNKVYQRVRENDNIASNEQYERLRSIINYLAKGKSVNRLDEIVGLSVEEICKDTSELRLRKYAYNAPQKLLDTLGIEIDKDLKNYHNWKYFNYNAPWTGQTSYDISNFNYFSTFTFNQYAINKMEIGDFDIRYNPKNQVISFFAKKNGVLAYQTPLKEKLLYLTKYGNNMDNVEKEEFILESNNDSIRVKFVFTELRYQIKKDSIQLNQASAYLFLKQ